jgi:hypothetical protein
MVEKDYEQEEKQRKSSRQKRTGGIRNVIRRIFPYDLEKSGKLLATPGVSAQPGCIE